MMTDTNAPLSPGVTQAIAEASGLAFQTKAQVLKQHRKRLREIAFHQGTEGVARYKREHPEAASIRVNMNAIAYSPKPKGYDNYLCSLTERWLVNKGAVNETNTADVGRLNARFDTAFAKANHFNGTLSAGRLSKIAATFARNGIDLDTRQATTMSKIRAFAKARLAGKSAERGIGSLGAISENHLLVSGQAFRIERNGQRDCIRVTIGGKRRRLYLDEMEWLAGLLADKNLNMQTTTI